MGEGDDEIPHLIEFIGEELHIGVRNGVEPVESGVLASQVTRAEILEEQCGDDF